MERPAVFKMKCYNIKKRAYSFIELLVVLGIISILSGLSIAAYNNFNQKQILQKDANRLIDTLELAKKKANAPDCPLGETLVSYNVVISSDGYQVLMKCSLSQLPISDYKFSSGITSTTPTSVNFFPLSLGATNKTLILTNTSQCVKITVTQPGVISSDNPCP